MTVARRAKALILQRDSYTCAYCGRSADSIDHVVPKRLGGASVPTNLVAACLGCNSKKHIKIVYLTPPDIPEWEERYTRALDNYARIYVDAPIPYERRTLGIYLTFVRAGKAHYLRIWPFFP